LLFSFSFRILNLFIEVLSADHNLIKSELEKYKAQFKQSEINVLKLSKQLQQIKLENEQLKNELQFKQNQIEKLLIDRQKEKDAWRLKKEAKKGMIDSVLSAFNTQMEAETRKSVGVNN
jgi:hypothetical protein